ncbi:MAG: hypothetical protein HC925_09800 [Coleofasciculaceae cyanobacterium SM2_3_26]|nr:hypothetical protein [Coleofasciculaceae cyanobacterium SM2_3_26]
MGIAGDFYQGMEQFFEEVSREFEVMGEAMGEVMGEVMGGAIAQFADEVYEQVERAIATEADRLLEEWLEPFAELYVEVEFYFEEGGAQMQPPATYEMPSTHHHPACIGCRHYHGYAYNGNLLVCGMHPSGWEGDRCPDWESERKTGEQT